MKYSEALKYLYTQLPMYQRQGKSAFKKDLKNILALLDVFGHPQNAFKAIHIAGTNGKGTVSHLMAGFLHSQGQKVGLYSSPHYLDFRERIKVDGNLCDRSYVTAFTARLKQMDLSFSPSFFEITVAMAFCYFKEKKVDVAVIETGLGGRLDSTNVLNPILSIITNISLDHTHMLGDTLPAIAAEKAGIIKKGIPVVIGEYQEEVASVFAQKAQSENADLTYAEKVVTYKKEKIYHKDGRLLLQNRAKMAGPFHDKNFLTATAAMAVLEHSSFYVNWKVIDDFLPSLVSQWKYIGRCQWLSEDPLTLVDSAHNEGGLTEMMDFLEQKNFNKIHFVLGFVNDKDLTQILPLFPRKGNYYFAKAKIPRGLDASSLQHTASEFGLHGNAYTSVRKAYAAARVKYKKGELIYIGGSIFTVSEVLNHSIANV